jgi:hypothetical protein
MALAALRRKGWRKGRSPHYAATDPKPELVCEGGEREDGLCGWKPSIYMPRWASRLTLDVINVRVERLQDINETDAISEGMAALSRETLLKLFPDYAEAVGLYSREPQHRPPLGPTPRERFWRLWDSINVKRGFGWNANPWVWVVEFKRVTP